MTDDERERIMAVADAKARAAAALENRIVDLETCHKEDAARILALEQKLDKWFRNAVWAIAAAGIWLFQDSLEKIRGLLRP